MYNQTTVKLLGKDVDISNLSEEEKEPYVTKKLEQIAKKLNKF